MRGFHSPLFGTACLGSCSRGWALLPGTVVPVVRVVCGVLGRVTGGSGVESGRQGNEEGAERAF